MYVDCSSSIKTGLGTLRCKDLFVESSAISGTEKNVIQRGDCGRYKSIVLPPRYENTA